MLIEELRSFPRDSSRRQTHEDVVWRRPGAKHDDAVFALCLAAWWEMDRQPYVDKVIREEDVWDPPQPAGYNPITATPLPPLP